MAAFFTVGEQKKRPGVYMRYENYGTPMAAGAADGVCAAVVRSNWGPVGKAVLLEGLEEIAKNYGEGTTTNVPYEMFRGGAKKVYVARLGTGGTQGIYDIENTLGDKVVKVVMLYPGSRQFQLVIRDSITDSLTKELLLVENTVILQALPFTKANEDEPDEVTSLLTAYSEIGSKWFTLNKINDGSGELAIIDQEMITPGTEPLINAAAYSEAFEALEPYRFNVIGIDTNDTAIQSLLHAYINRVYNDGKLIMGVIGEPTDIPFETRMKNARAFNDYKIVYVGSGFIDSSENEYNGYLAAARVAGMIAGTSSDRGITNMILTGAVGITEILTNSGYIKATENGMLTFSVSASGDNWIESGVTTLVTPGATDDAGWKKIKRTKIRFELMQRISDTIEVLVAKVNNDEDGRATIIQAAQGVCNTMVSERKLFSGAKVVVDPGNPPKGDSAWFIIYADDIDALEKIYFTLKLRFAPEE